MDDDKTISVGEARRALRGRLRKLGYQSAAISRKRSWRASEKAMALADIIEETRTINAALILLGKQCSGERLPYIL